MQYPGVRHIHVSSVIRILKKYQVDEGRKSEPDIHGSVHHNTVLIKKTNKMQLSRIIYYSIVPWLVYMFRAILSLIIRSIVRVITASGFIHMCSNYS
jgi:hypothetical protein